MALGAPRVDLIAGGFPCKGASSAGKQNGFEHAETVLWHEMRRVIGDLRPRYVLIENVRDILSVALAPGEPAGSLWGAVLADMAALGFDVVWDCVPAAAVGAPHLRDRIFAIATQAARANEQRDGGQREQQDRRPDAPRGRDLSPSHADAAGRQQRGGPIAGAAQLATAERARENAPHADEQRRGDGPQPARSGLGSERRRTDAPGIAVDWGEYQPAIHRWETIHGTAPQPLIRRLDDGNPAVQRMRTRMDRSELRTQRQRLSALGDGVHVYVAWLVGQHIMSLIEQDRAAA